MSPSTFEVCDPSDSHREAHEQRHDHLPGRYRTETPIHHHVLCYNNMVVIINPSETACPYAQTTSSAKSSMADSCLTLVHAVIRSHQADFAHPIISTPLGDRTLALWLLSSVSALTGCADRHILLDRRYPPLTMIGITPCSIPAMTVENNKCSASPLPGITLTGCPQRFASTFPQTSMACS